MSIKFSFKMHDGRKIPPEMEDIYDKDIVIGNSDHLLTRTAWNPDLISNNQKDLDVLDSFRGRVVGDLFSEGILKTYDPFNPGELNLTKCFIELKAKVIERYFNEDLMLSERIVYRLALSGHSRFWGSITLDTYERALFTPYMYDPNHTIYPTVKKYKQQRNICKDTCSIYPTCVK